MKRFFSILTAMAVVLSCTPQAGTSPDTPVFRFHEDGTFKVMQVTDTHLSVGDSEEEFSFVLNQIARVLETEKPDLLVFTGDIVTSCSTYDIWQKLLAAISPYGVPFVVTYGNHDREEQLSDADLPQCFVNHPLNINVLSPEGYLEDMAIEVRTSAPAGDKTAAVLYVMDSGDYSPVETYWDYGWITHDQIHWYVEKSREYARANANVPVPSYAFFHIPVMEYYEAYETGYIAGHRGEPECPGELNSGILSAFEENGDVHAVFVGHDHDNDYIAGTGGIACVYGRCCFHKREGRVPGNGIRIIEISEGDYGFHTWVREADGAADDLRFEVPVDFRLRKATDVKELEPGLVRTMYSQVGDLFSIEHSAVKGETSVVATPRMIDRMGEGDYGAVQKGYIYVPQTGAVSFHLSASSEGACYIDDIRFRDTDYNRGQLKMNLEKGYHPIKLLMRTVNGGGCWTKLMWRDQYHARYHEIPAEYFFCAPENKL